MLSGMLELRGCLDALHHAIRQQPTVQGYSRLHTQPLSSVQTARLSRRRGQHVRREERLSWPFCRCRWPGVACGVGRADVMSVSVSLASSQSLAFGKFHEHAHERRDGPCRRHLEVGSGDPCLGGKHVTRRSRSFSGGCTCLAFCLQPCDNHVALVGKRRDTAMQHRAPIHLRRGR